MRNQTSTPLSALKRLLAALEADLRLAPEMTVKTAFETNGVAIAEAREAIYRAEFTHPAQADASNVAFAPVADTSRFQP